MIQKYLSTLKIHKLTQEQYERELNAGRIDSNALYLTEDKGQDLSYYATKAELENKSDKGHTHIATEIGADSIGSANKALSDAKIYTDSALTNKADKEHFHSIATATANGFMSADDNILLGKLRSQSLGSFGSYTIPQAKTALENWIASVYDTPNASAHFACHFGNFIYLWNSNDTTSTIGDGVNFTIELTTIYGANNYALLRLTSYYDKNVYYVAYSNGVWNPIRTVQFTDDVVSKASTILSTITNPTSMNQYVIPFHTSGTDYQSLLSNNGLLYNSKEGTTSTEGRSQFVLGNNIASGTAGNKYGEIALYGKSSWFAHIIPNNNMISNIAITLPSEAGTLALTKDFLPITGGTLTGGLDTTGSIWVSAGAEGDVGVCYKDGRLYFYGNNSTGNRGVYDSKYGNVLTVTDTTIVFHGKANSALTANNADIATKASQDGSGNVITSTYETKTNATSKLTEAKAYADTAATKVKNDLLNGAGAAYDTLKELGTLINENTTAIDALAVIATNKADKSHTHTIANVTNLQSSLDGKLSLSGGVMTGEIKIGQNDGFGIQLGKYGRINATDANGGTGNTVLGMNDNAASLIVGSPSFNMTMRGKANRPTYNGNNIALLSDANSKLPLTGGNLTGSLTTTNGHIFASSDNAEADVGVRHKSGSLYLYGNNGTGVRGIFDSKLGTFISVTDSSATFFGNATSANYSGHIIRNDGNTTAKLTYTSANKSSYGWGQVMYDANGKPCYVYYTSTTNAEAPDIRLYGADGSTYTDVLTLKNYQTYVATKNHTHDDRYYTETEIDSKLSRKANSSHGNHVPTTQTANNAVFLRNDNTWQTITPANIGAAASSHTHTYISSVGDYQFTSSTLPNSFSHGLSLGFVNSNSGFGSFGTVVTARSYSGGGGTLQLYAPYSPNYGGTHMKARFGNYDSSNGNSWTVLKEIAWVSDIPTKYAGSSSAGGAATTALACTGNSATATKATYDSAGNNISTYLRYCQGANNYVTITVEGDANTYYPVIISNITSKYASTLLNITRSYAETAPDSWNTATHKGGLTACFLTNGSTYWDGNGSGGSSTTSLLFLYESYSTMIGGIGNSVNGLVVWLRGGTATYNIHCNTGIGVSTSIKYSTFTDAASRAFAPRTTVDTDSINSYRNIGNVNINGYAGSLYDTQNGNKITASYGDAGISNPDWLAGWYGYQLRVTKRTDLTVGYSNVAAKLGRSGDVTVPMTFYWSGQSGQPTWLWGGSDGSNMYVYNPSNFNVNYANSAGSASSATSASYVKDRTNSTATYLNVGAAAIADPTYLAGWNGYELRAVSRTAVSVGYAGRASTVLGNYTSNGGQQNPNYFGTNKVGFLMMNTTVNGNSHYKDWMIMDCYSGNDVGGAVAIGVNRQALGAYIMRSEAARTSWAASAELLHSSNFTSFNSYGTLYTNNWFRSKGASGWYSEDYGGGWYMSDSSWIRTYGSKGIYQDSGILRTDGTLQVGANGAYFNSSSSGTNVGGKLSVTYSGVGGVTVEGSGTTTGVQILRTDTQYGLRVGVSSSGAQGLWAIDYNTSSAPAIIYRKPSDASATTYLPDRIVMAGSYGKGNPPSTGTLVNGMIYFKIIS